MPIVHLTEPMEVYARGQIRSGTHVNRSEVVRACIRLLMERTGSTRCRWSWRRRCTKPRPAGSTSLMPWPANPTPVRRSWHTTMIRLSRLARRNRDRIRRDTVGSWGRWTWPTYFRCTVPDLEGIAVHTECRRDRSLFATGPRQVGFRLPLVRLARVVEAGDEPAVLRVVHQCRNLPAQMHYIGVGG